MTIAAGPTPHPRVRRVTPPYSLSTQIPQNELFAGLAGLGFINGISEKVIQNVVDNGLVFALSTTFNISAIVWIAFAVAIKFLLQAPSQQTIYHDWILACFLVAAFLVPIGPLSWIALSGLAFYILRRSSRSSLSGRGAWILLAVTIPMFWSRVLFALLSDLILQGDAILVGWIVGTHNLGNTVQFADGSGYLWIAPGCSSWANISLAILCWITFTKVFDRPSSLQGILWMITACMAVVGINVTRISLIGFYPEHYETLHGPIGDVVASWTIFAVTIGMCWIGVKHGRCPPCT
jgi:exosortase/archaeosortase family protein